MDTEDLEWIMTIRANASELLHNCEEFENDVSGPSFDIDDARAYFEA